MNQESFSNRQKSSSCLRNMGPSYSFSNQRMHYSLKKRCGQEISYPFKPEVHEIPTQLYFKTAKTECSREDLFERLVQNKIKDKLQLTRQKIKHQEDTQKQMCTFKPKINQNSKKLTEEYQSQKSPFNRLYADALAKCKAKQTVEISQIEARENYPFQPTIEPFAFLNSEKRDLRPLYQRIKDIIIQKQQHIKSLRAIDHQEKTKYLINEKSNEIVMKKKDFKADVLERFQSYIQERKKKTELKQWEIEQRNSDLCPFRPTIGPHPIAINQPSFADRQQDFASVLRQKLDLKMENFLKENFRPQINQVSNLLVRAQRENQTQDQKIQRMINKPIILKEQEMHRIASQVYRQCTFQPQINSISKALNARHVGHECHCIPQPKQYDFTPKINSNSRELAERFRKNNCRVTKSNLVDKVKMTNEYQEMKQCTFKPKINGQSKRSGSLSSIRGLDIFNKKLELIKGKREYEEKIKQKMFHLQKQYQPRKKTNIEEFKLSQGYNQYEKAKKQQLQKFEKQCPFRPSINQLR